jgi:hypothetical protein
MEDLNQKEMNRIESLLHAYAEKVGINASNVDGDKINNDFARILFT